jgi:hypothetical protein
MLRSVPRHKCSDTDTLRELHADTNMAKKPKVLKRAKKLSPAKKLEKKTTLRRVDVLVPRLPA